MRFSPELLADCWFLAGPTACGKTETSLCLAQRLGAEIVSLDSMAVYRGMDVGTAKPSPAARETVPHHLIDIVAPHEEFSVAAYVAAAHAACRDICARGCTPLFVGGTALYLRSVLRGVFVGPPADWEFRWRMHADAEAHGVEALHRRLAEVDAQAARRLHPRDERRIVRALEVYHLTGRPLSEQQRHPPLPRERRPQRVFWLSPPRAWLYANIDRRVEAMIAAGLVEEVKRLLESEHPLSRTARQAVGYREVIDHLNGRLAYVDCVRSIQTRTRQFAKRQHTWFRHLEECRAIAIDGSESDEALVERIIGASKTI
jgi:tRNA dimethylallyltransferase